MVTQPPDEADKHSVYQRSIPDRLQGAEQPELLQVWRWAW